MKRSLEGKCALVTGGSRGIGRGIALALAEAGASVAICYLHDGPDVEETLCALRGFDVQAEAFKADVSNEEQVDAMVEAGTKMLGGLDIVVNNAGILDERPLVETTAEQFDRVIAVNLRGTFLVGRAAARVMAKRRTETPARIINIASDLGHLGRENMTAYTASKGAIMSMTRTWARELAPSILVNAIAPGPIETDMLTPEFMSPEAIAADLATPLARFGSTDEIGALAAFLCTDGAAFTTGQVYGVNGGSVMT